MIMEKIYKYNSMKPLHIAITIFTVMVLLSPSCSSYEELDELNQNTEINSDTDTVISFSVTYDATKNTRSSDFNPLKDYLVWRNAVKDVDADYDENIPNQYGWRPIHYEYSSYYDKSNLIDNYHVILGLPDNTIIENKKNYTYNEETNYRHTYSFTIPKSIKKRDIKVLFAADSRSKRMENGNLFSDDADLRFAGLSFLPTSEFKDSLKSRFNHNDSFSFNSYKKVYGNKGEQISELENTLFLASPTTAVATAHELYDESGNFDGEVVAKNLSSAIIVMTDEFNSYEGNMLGNVQHDGILNRLYPPAFNYACFSSIDWKSNRKIAEYLPNFQKSGNYSSTGFNKDREYDLYSYDLSFFNLVHKQQFCSLGKHHFRYLTYNHETIFDFGHKFCTFNDPVWDGGNKNRYYHVSSNRYFLPVASRNIVAPYGRAHTLDSKINDCLTHFSGNDELDKELKYLVVNLIPDSWSEGLSDQTAISNKWFRFVYEIPEEGLKPGYVYIIKNKAGNKLFKEWDESTGTTRASDSEYVVDKSCYEIEEIPL